jgi:hypothetical protein
MEELKKLQDEYNAIKAKIDENKDEIINLYNKEANLNKDLYKVLLAIVLKSNILSKYDWFLDYKGKDYLVLVSSKSDEEYKELDFLFDKDYVSTHSLSKDIKLRQHDGEITLTFDNNTFTEFQEKFKLNIKLKHKHYEDFANLKELIEMFPQKE